MNYESPLKQFRDEWKNPDEYKKEHPGWRDPELGPLNNEEGKSSPVFPEKQEKIGVFGLRYQETVNLVKSAGLKEAFVADTEEADIIESRRQTILRYLQDVLDDARNYLSQVNYLQLQKEASYNSPEEYREAVGVSDGQRRIYHNKLISDLKTVTRLINVNFSADFPENLRLKQELNMDDRRGLSSEELQKKLAERKYFHFPYPGGAFIDLSKAPKDPQGEREYIADWALKIYSDLSSLSEDILQK